MRPPETFVISDLHFNHEKLVTHGARPAGFTQKIIKQCQRLIMPQDLVICTGDVIMGAGRYLKDIMAQMPGRWVLVLGNHDKESPTWYTRNGFMLAVESMVYRGILFTHKPAQYLPDGVKLNVHGHFHNFKREVWELPVHPWNKLFTLEWTDYAPMLLSKFLCTTLSGPYAEPLAGHSHLQPEV